MKARRETPLREQLEVVVDEPTIHRLHERIAARTRARRSVLQPRVTARAVGLGAAGLAFAAALLAVSSIGAGGPSAGARRAHGTNETAGASDVRRADREAAHRDAANGEAANGEAGHPDAALRRAALRHADGRPLVVATHEGAVSWTLSEGSRVWTSPSSRLRVVHNRAEELALALDRGHVALDVVPGGGRTIRVATALGEVHVLGTRFSVDARPREMRVAVERGHVRVTARGSAEVVDLFAGDAYVVDERAGARRSAFTPPRHAARDVTDAPSRDAVFDERGAAHEARRVAVSRARRDVHAPGGRTSERGSSSIDRAVSQRGGPGAREHVRDEPSSSAGDAPAVLARADASKRRGDVVGAAAILTRWLGANGVDAVGRGLVAFELARLEASGGRRAEALAALRIADESVLPAALRPAVARLRHELEPLPR